MILHDAGFGFGLPGGGAEAYCELLSTINLHLDNAIIKVALGKEEGVGVVTLEGSKIPIARTIYDKHITEGLRELCKDFKADLIHANILNAHYPLIVSRISRSLGLPLIVTVHSWAYLCPTAWNVMLPEPVPCAVSSMNRRCLKCMMFREGSRRSQLTAAVKMLHGTYALQLLLKGASCVISPSAFFAKRLYERLGIRAYHIPNPVNPLLLREEPRSEGDSSVVFVGRLEFEKGVHLLPCLAKIINPINVHVLGRGRLEELLLQGRFPNLFYHGFVTEHEKLDLIRKTSVMIIPSVWCDMFPTTVFEAFALGKPVVAFDLGGPKEMIEASGGGLLAKPFDIENFAEKVTYLVENPTEARKMGLMGRRWIEKNLHPDCFAESLAKVYEYAMISGK